MTQSMHKQLREIGTLLKLDCGDNSCLAAEHKGGMRTNGGCRCDFVGAVKGLQDALEAMKVQFGEKMIEVQQLEMALNLTMDRYS